MPRYFEEEQLRTWKQLVTNITELTNSINELNKKVDKMNKELEFQNDLKAGYNRKMIDQ